MIEYNNLLNDIILTKTGSITSFELFLFIIFALLASLLIDIVFGELPTKIHPVVIIGSLIGYFKKTFIGFKNRFSGLFVVLGVCIVSSLILYIIYLIISMLAAIVGVLLFAKNSDEKYALDKIDEKITEKQKYTWLFTSWAIIVFLCLNAFEAFTFSSFYAKIIQFINGY